MSALPRSPALLLLGAIVLGFFYFAFINFLAAGRDDIFIMLWSGQTLGSAPWFVNYNHQLEEMSSSIIGTFAAATTIGQPIGRAMLMVKVLGLLAASATLVLMWRKRALFFHQHGQADWLMLCAVLATATSLPFGYWSMGGLETPYHALLLLLFAATLAAYLSSPPKDNRLHWGLALTGIALFLVRTEGFWPLLVALAVGVAVRGKDLQPLLKATALTCLAFALLLGLRSYYTGDPWPNPVYAKVGGIRHALPWGIGYIERYFASTPWTMVQAAALVYGVGRLLQLVLARLQGRVADSGLIPAAVLAAVTLGQLLIVAMVGGTWMEYFRFIVAVVPLLNILVLLAAGDLLAWARGRDWLARDGKLAVFSLCAIAAAVCMVQLRFKDPGHCASPLPSPVLAQGLAGVEAHVLFGNCAHDRDMIAIGPFINSEFRDHLRPDGPPLAIVSYQAGFFPYYLRQHFSRDEIVFIDSMGLGDKAIARTAGGKSIYGNSAGARLDKVLMGAAGELSRVVIGRQPSMAYATDADDEMRDNFLKLGWNTVWDQPRAIVFSKEASAHPLP